MTSIAAIYIQGTVPTVAQVTVAQTGEGTFTVHEVCNDPNGYKVTITTENSQFVLTDQYGLTKSVDRRIQIKLKATIIQATMEVK